MSQKRINKLVKLLKDRLRMTEEQAIDFICDAAFEKQYGLLPVKELTDEEDFNLVLNNIEAYYHGDIRIVVKSNCRGGLHVEIQEVADEYDWENITDDGWLTINKKYNLKDYKEAMQWLESQYSIIL